MKTDLESPMIIACVQRILIRMRASEKFLLTQCCVFNIALGGKRSLFSCQLSVVLFFYLLRYLFQSVCNNCLPQLVTFLTIMARKLNNIRKFMELCPECGASPKYPICMTEPPGLMWNINFPRVLDLNYRNGILLPPLSNN